MTRTARWVAVFAVSAGTLACEVLLVRVFAIEQFHHFATMAVSLAMLGVGAAGTGFSLARRRAVGASDRWFITACLLTALSLVVSPIAAHLLRVDATALAWDPRQWTRLAALYLLLAAPFGFGALAVLTALSQVPERPGALYGASLMGSGLGAVLALAVLWVMPPVQALGLPAVVASAGAAVASFGGAASRRVRWCSVLIGVTAGIAVAFPRQPRLNPHKTLPQVLAFPGARVVEEQTSPVGWIMAVDAPAFRHLPGLSLAYRGAFPRQTAVFVDGDLAEVIASGNGESEAALDWLPLSLPFTWRRPQRVLVLGGEAGLLVPMAVKAGADEVAVVQLQPDVVRLAEASGAIPGHGIRWIVGGARTFAAGTRQRFDAIVLGSPAGGGAGAAAAALQEDFDQTVEAYRRYLMLLREGGVLAVTVWAAEPPRAEVRAAMTAGEALRRISPEAAAGGLAVVRSWGTVTILVKPDGFSQPEVAALEAWSNERWFDLAWRPGLAAPSLRYNTVERSAVFDAVRALVAGPDSVERFLAAYPLDVRPATDKRPYPHHFVGFKAIGWLLRRPRGDWLPFAEWGHLALLATLVQGAMLAAACMAVPAALQAGRPAGGSTGRLLGYFTAIGVGYLAAEIAAIQQLTLLLGHPVYAVAAGLAAVLVVSGLGSLVSDRLDPRAASRLTLLLALVLSAYAVGLLPVAQALQTAPLAGRAAAALALLVPAAVLMGMPFALGVRAIAGADPSRLAWAWAANGFASVVAAPLAALVALEAGHGAVFGLAAVAYLVAAVTGKLPGMARQMPSTGIG